MTPVSRDISTRLRARIEGYRADMIALQQELTSIPAIGPENGGTGEWERGELLVRTLAAFGLPDVRTYHAADPRVPDGLRPNLAVTLGGRRGAPAVWVIAHLDTVPPGDLSLWRTDPFQAVLDGDRLIGRGVEDNQQGLVAALFALRALVDEGIQPPGKAGLLLIADEEAGNGFGLEHVMATEPSLIRLEDLVVVPDFGLPDGSGLEVAEKSTLWCEVAVHGRQVHASMPDDGANAHRASAHLAVRLDELLGERFPATDGLFTPARSTFEPTKREPNVQNVNTIPGEDVFYLDCRVLPEYDLSDVLAVIREAGREIETRFGVRVDVTPVHLLPAAPPTAVDAPVVVALSEAIYAARGVESTPLGIGGGTVASVLRKAGIPAVVWSTQDQTAHQPNEYCLVSNMVEDAAVFALLFLSDG